MKIVFCLGEMNKGGAERVVCNLANYLVSMGNEVTLIVTKLAKMEYEFDKKIKIHILDDEKIANSNLFFRNFKRISKLKKTILGEKTDLCFAFLQEPIARALLLKLMSLKVRKIPLIISVRIDPKKAFGSFKRKLSLILYNLADGFVFQTKDAQSFFNKKIQARSIVIGNPINPLFFETNENIKKEKTIIAVGRLTEQKNYPMMIKAFNLVKEEIPGYQLKIFGDGVLKDTLNTMIENYNLKESIKLMGNSDNIKSEMEKSMLFVISSDYEGMSNSLMEAMALGIPCISTNSSGGGAKTLIDDGKNGILVPVGDYNELGQAIKKLLSNDKIYKSISNEGKKSMANYAPDIINNMWLDYVETVIKSRKK